MASSSTRKQCAKEDGCKQAAVTNCEGCSKAFCIKHFNDHRRLLDEEMNIIIDEHDHLKNTLNQHMTKPATHPLISDINDWEKESIAKIQQRAKELRQALLQSITVHESELSKKLQQLSEKLKESRENDDFIETDLQHWKQTLDDVKTNLTSPSTISINRCDNISLVRNIFINSFMTTKDIFERTSDNKVQIEENGQLVVRNHLQTYTEVRGKNEYESGRHEIRLRIEQYNDGWMFFGINSKSMSLQKMSYKSKSACGWSSNNLIWLNGSSQDNKTNLLVEMKMNDIIAIIFECDNRKILMINERTKAKHELDVNIGNCPFPWQLHVILNEPNSRVRILQT
jgi:hypothetical protein